MNKLFLKKHLLTVLILLTALSSTACSGRLIYFDADCKGKVVDAETGEPIESAVAVGAWFKAYPTIAGTSSDFYDAYETMTDRNGEFTIPGKGLRLFSNLDEMRLTLVKAKYSFIDGQRWSVLKENPNIKREGQRLVFKLRKRSIVERRRLTPSSAPHVPQNMQRTLLKEINVDIKELGFSLY